MEHKSASDRAIHTNKTEVIVIVAVKKDTFKSHLVSIVLVYGPKWSEKKTLQYRSQAVVKLSLSYRQRLPQHKVP